MNTFTPYQLGPLETPGVVKWLIIAILSVSLFTAVFDPIYEYFFNTIGLSYLIGLSKAGLSHFLIWQPVTHLFAQPLAYSGISLGYLIGLAFNLYILWIIGTAICERIGTQRFLYFFLATGAIAGLLAIPFASYSYILLGCYASLLALFTFWSMLAPESEILLFFVIPVKVKWLFAFIAGALLLVSLSQLDFVSFVQSIAAIASAYLYGTMGWQLSAPFSQLEPVDRFFYKLSDYLPAQKVVHPTKIYDLRTGEPVLDDDQFIDAMLAKIAKHGQESLSWSERKRMQDISLKKRNQQR